MKRSVSLWILAIVVTLVSVVWQRATGPTYPIRGKVTLGGREIRVRLLRSHGGEGDMPVRIDGVDGSVGAEIAWRRFPTNEAWQVLALARKDGGLEASLPHQPPAGKLEYQIRLARGPEKVVFPERPAVTRFKGDVPAAVLVPHIFAMFLGMLLSTRAGLEAIARIGEPRRLAVVTLALIGFGGFVLGPMVQKAAFGAWWTGIPFGYDLTDNKTLLAGLAWGFAVWRLRGGRPARGAVVVAALVTLAVFAIPHSTWGSQIRWNDLPAR